MKENTLAVEERTNLKKSANKNLRKAGNIPAVVYGGGQPKNICVNEREFEKKFHNVPENTIISLIQNEKTICNVLIKDYQEDIRTSKIAHIDFFEVDSTKKVKAKVPIILTGTSIGVKMGGILEQLAHDIEVECLPADLPENISVAIDTLDLGHSIHLADIKTTDKVKFLSPGHTVIAHVVHLKVATEDVKAEEEVAEVSDGATKS